MSGNSAVRETAGKEPATQRVYYFGVRARSRLISTARKVRRDFAALSPDSPETPRILAVLDAILTEADRWRDRSAGVAPQRGDYVALLPSGHDWPHGEIALWARQTEDLQIAVARLGTYCHFALKEARKAQSRENASGPPAASPARYREWKRKNALLNHLEILLGRTRLASFPQRLELDPTNECNLRCRACQHGITKDFHHTEFSPENIDRLEEAFPFVEYAYLFGRGEPTMATVLPRLIGEAARHEVQLDLLTNGTLVDRVRLPWTALHRLGVSIDGATEETMRLLRPVAPVARVLEAVAQMRAKAPQAILYAKVTMSRMNFPELPALVERLGAAGVNEVIVHSLDVFHAMHEAIQVRQSDREEMAKALAEARAAAARHGMAFVNTMSFDAVARPDNQPRDPAGMVQILQQTPLPVLRVAELREVRERLEAIPFAYHPPSVLQVTGLTPPEGPPPPEVSGPIPVRPETIDDLVHDLAVQVRGLTTSEVRIPYCFAPWKMPLIGSDGRARACCHLHGHLGDLDQGRTFHDVWSAPGFAQLREAMFDLERLPDSCARCEAHERSMMAAETVAVADLLAVPVRQAPRYPVPMDVSALLRSPGRAAAPRFEVLGGADGDALGRFVIPPQGQMLARFPNPRSVAGVYYQGRFRITGGKLLVGVKPLWGHDLWNYLLEPAWLSLLEGWLGLPMPPLTVDFSSCAEAECALFLWAPPDNSGPVEVTVADFSGVATVPAPRRGDGVHLGHFWTGFTAAG